MALPIAELRYNCAAKKKYSCFGRDAERLAYFGVEHGLHRINPAGAGHYRLPGSPEPDPWGNCKMDWDQISRNWDEMTLRIQPQSRLQSSGLSGGKGALSVIKVAVHLQVSWWDVPIRKTMRSLPTH